MDFKGWVEGPFLEGAPIDPLKRNSRDSASDPQLLLMIQILHDLVYQNHRNCGSIVLGDAGLISSTVSCCYGNSKHHTWGYILDNSVSCV